jgi:hypothetical protein
LTLGSSALTDLPLHNRIFELISRQRSQENSNADQALGVSKHRHSGFELETTAEVTKTGRMPPKRV